MKTEEEMNPFSVGQKVVCISENFPIEITTDEDKSRLGEQAYAHPVIGEQLIIDEILGGFIRFDKFDSDNPLHPNYGFNWWHYTRFSPIKKMENRELEYAYLNNKKG
jgi:hypothetical protein